MRLSATIRVSALIAWVATSNLMWGCTGKPWLAAAQRGSLLELKKSVVQGQQRNAFDRDAVAELAQTVLQREIQAATDPDGEPLIAELEPCALAVESSLRKRAQRRDETAGNALVALVAAGWHMPAGDWAEGSVAQSGARRAAAALASSLPARWAKRDALLNDPDVRVRRLALRSAVAVPVRDHWEALVSILRRDPDPMCRQLAAKAIGALGDAEASTVLTDAWGRADVALRLAIVSGWAQAPTFSAGGRRQLLSVARSEPGIVGVSAAADLATGTSDLRAFGQARITRSLEFGSSEDRPLAVMAADWALDEQAEQLLKLGLHAEPELRVLALQRWLEHPEHRWPAVTWLRGLSEGNDGSAILAREVLANFGDPTVRLALRAQLRYAKAVSRAHAARYLWILGDTGGVAQALADDAPEVRVAAACIVLGPRPAR